MRSFFAGLFLTGLVAILFIGGFALWFSLSKPNPDSEIAERSESPLTETLEKLLTRKDAPRDWTDLSGKSISALLIHADPDTALVRVDKNQRLYRIPRSRLSGEDQSFLDRWIEDNPDPEDYPPIPDRWPRVFDGRTKKHAYRSSTSKGWKIWETQHYEMRAKTPIEPGMLDSVTLICESIDEAIRSVPLPLAWGRPAEEKRIINLYSTAKTYLKTGGQENWGGHYDPRSHEVHLRLDLLNETDVRAFYGQYSIKKRNKYNLLVHELVHQATLGLLLEKPPAWVPEGVSEYFSAMQQPPGRFDFSNTLNSVRRHVSESLDLDGLVEVKKLRIENLDSFLYIGLANFNRRTAQSAELGFSYYNGSLILAEFFTHGDNNSLRAYLEAVLTGVRNKDAIREHLLRGRTPSQIEILIQQRWKSQGIEIIFEEEPVLEMTDLQGEVGLESNLINFRSGL